MRSLLVDNDFAGYSLRLEDLTEEKINIDSIVDKIIDGRDLYKNVNNNKNAYFHFEELAKLLKG